MFSLRSFVTKCVRVWHLLRRPTKNEFVTIAKVSAIGLGVIGLIGFAVSILMKFVQI